LKGKTNEKTINTTRTPMATPKSPTCGRVKIPHPQAAERV
jgi:hypothetical protein